MICRELHNERSRFTGKCLKFLQHDTGNNNCCNTDKECGGCHQGGSSEDRACKETDDRHLCAARDKSGRHDRHFTITVLLNRTGCHDTRNAAAGCHQHRDEALTGQTKTAENTVHDERNTRHITDILKDCQEQEQYQDLRNKSKHRADAGNDTILDQGVQHTLHMQSAEDTVKKSRNDLTEQHIVYPVGSHGSDRERIAAHRNRINHKHNYCKNRKRQNPVRHDLVDLIRYRHAVLCAFFLHSLCNDAADKGISLICDDALRVIIQLVFTRLNCIFHILRRRTGKLQILHDPFVPLKHLYRIPAKILRVHLAGDRRLDLADCILHASGVHLKRSAFFLCLCSSHGFICRLHASLRFQSAHLDRLAAKCLSKLI